MAKINTERQKFWSTHVQAQVSSGLSQKKYCDEHGIKLARFVYYRAQLVERKQSPEPEMFVEVTPAPAQVNLVRVTLPSGATIECPPATEADWLATVIAGMSGL